MKQKKTSPQSKENSKYDLTNSLSHPYSSLPWSSLTDIEKSQLLLGSHRFLDADQFIQEFKSFEGPDNNSQ